MRIWVTRTAPGNHSTVESLQALGHDVVCVPVLDVRRVDPGPLRSLPDAIVFTSGNGVRHHPICSEALDLPVFTVGNRTADAVMRAGYRNVRSADGDLGDLQRLILDELPPPCRIVHFGAREPAGDLKSHLRRYGYLVDRKVVYIADAVAVRWLLRVRTDLPNIDAIMVHSPRAAERVARVLSKTDWSGKIWCISEACAHKLARVPNVQVDVASKPTELALRNLVHQGGSPRTHPRPLVEAVPPCAARSIRLGPGPPANDNDAPSDEDEDGGGDDEPPSAA
jgi:uroporphyrinogen-III synthase